MQHIKSEIHLFLSNTWLSCCSPFLALAVHSAFPLTSFQSLFFIHNSLLNLRPDELNLWRNRWLKHERDAPPDYSMRHLLLASDHVYCFYLGAKWMMEPRRLLIHKVFQGGTFCYLNNSTAFSRRPLAVACFTETFSGSCYMFSFGECVTHKINMATSCLRSNS